MNNQATQTVRISRNDFFNIIRNIKSATPITITALTDVKMNKKGNPFYDRIQKLQVLNGMINFIYENSVNNQLAREHKEKDFTASERKWGEHETKAIINNNGRDYLQIKPEKSISVEYLCDGSPISKDEIADWLKAPSSGAEHQGVNKEVVVRAFKDISIVAATVNKVHYELF